MSKSTPEPWLRGGIPGVPPLLQPVAHALVHAREDVAAAVEDLSPAQVWHRVGNSASIGFHLVHLAGSTDRLLTYARGDALSDAQRSALDRERRVGDEGPPVHALLQQWDDVVQAALRQLMTTPEASLTEERLVGRAQHPSTVLGLLFHAAEHAARHTGQIVTTAKVLRVSGPAF
jgi:uncharacterized damage-inducible protein DinB